MKNWIERHPEVIGILWALFALSQFVSLISFHAGHISSNWLGLCGHIAAWIWYAVFGLSSFFILLGLAFHAYRLIFKLPAPSNAGAIISLVLAGASLSMLLTLIACLMPTLEAISTPFFGFDPRFRLGGMPFYSLFQEIPYINFKHLLNFEGTALVGSASLFLSLAYFFDIHFSDLIQALRRQKSDKQKKPKTEIIVQPDISGLSDASNKKAKPKVTRSIPSVDHFLDLEQDYPLGPELVSAPISTSGKRGSTEKKASTIVEIAAKDMPKQFGNFSLPPIDLLHPPKKTDSSSIVKELKTKADLLEETLLSFGIEAKVGQIHCGPTITSFEVHPAVGVKIGKIKTLEHDIALNLEAKSIRIIAPIPGKPAVGIEVPNKQPQEVSFKELLSGYLQQGSPCKIPMLLGKAVNGDLVIADLAKMPHCIIAGATGSGKSVCINSIVMSILLTATPDQIRLLMIDPKKVELTPYTELPHMLSPVITEASNACAALQWLVREMEKRYEILKLTGQRNIDAFNRRTIDSQLEKTFHVPIPEKLPYYVGIIDELADLMMVASQDIETPIARIAQMARAVGIHLILATQRPSREVITGLIRANFPARIAFKVASRINSQIILDDTGAENLLGNGDMLFLLPGNAQLIRAQGAFVRDEEINKVIEHITKQAPPQYLINSFDDMRMSSAKQDDDDANADSLYDEAKSIVLSTGNASTTFLQRKLKIGYARAASLMDALETKQVVGPQEGSKPRKVLYPKGGGPEPDDDLFDE